MGVESGKIKHFQAALTVVPWTSILTAVPFGATTESSVD